MRHNANIWLSGSQKYCCALLNLARIFAQREYEMRRENSNCEFLVLYEVGIFNVICEHFDEHFYWLPDRKRNIA